MALASIAYASAPILLTASQPARCWAIRSAALPSHSSGTRPRCHRIENLADEVQNPPPIAPDQRIGTLLHGDRPLGVLDAW